MNKPTYPDVWAVMRALRNPDPIQAAIRDVFGTAEEPESPEQAQKDLDTWRQIRRNVQDKMREEAIAAANRY